MFTLLAVVGLLSSAVAADPRRLKIVDSTPKAHEVLDGTGVVFSLKLNGLIDHRRSKVLLKGAGEIRELRPRLSAAPQYIYLRVGHLESGQYELTWQARTATGYVVRKIVPFTVK